MAFLREHSFILGLVAALVVLGGIVLALDFSKAGSVTGELKDRAEFSAGLKTLVKPPRVNAKVLKAETDRVEQSQAAAKIVIDRNVEWNRGDFEIMQLSYTDGAGGTRTIPAFPIQREEYNDFGLIFVLTRTYLLELRSMLKDLKATQPPTPEEVRDEQDRLARKLAAKRAAEERKKGLTPLEKGTRRPGRTFPGRQRTSGMYMYGKMDPMLQSKMGPDFGARRQRQDTPDVAAEAQLKGLESIRIKKARMGEVYADMGSLDLVFEREDVHATDTEMWNAQVNLWVTREIIEAIRDTNAQVLSELPPGQRNVLRAPVKRLVSLQVERDYYTREGAASPSKRSGAKSRQRIPQKGMPPFGMKGRDMYPMKGPGGYGPKGYPDMGPAKTHRATTAAGVEPFSDLTGRASTTSYDVVRYHFTVIMPMRYLPDLQLSLLKRTNHTVLNVNISKAAALPLTDASSIRPSESNLYYYGTDSVAEITLGCELLLMTAWERGTYDSETQKWSQRFPPLMPKEVLSGLAELVPGAIRQEDETRLNER